MALFSFGASSSKNKQTDTLNKTENVFQQQNTNQNQSTTGTQDTSQTGTSTSTGNSATTGSQASSQTNNQTQTGTTTTLDAKTQAGLQGLFQQLLGATGSGVAQNTLDSQLGQLGQFNVDDYVKGTTDAAAAKINSAADAAVGVSDSKIGGTASTNSMAALLDQRIRSDAASSIAGVQGQASATAAQIAAGNVSAAQGSVNSGQNFLMAVADALKGATSSTSTAGTGTTTGTTSNTSNTATSESNQNQQNTNTQSQQDVATMIEQILNGVTTTNAVQTSKGSSSKFGGGISL